MTEPVEYYIWAVEYRDRRGYWQFITAYKLRSDARKHMAACNRVTHYVEGTTKYRVVKYERTVV